MNSRNTRNTSYYNQLRRMGITICRVEIEQKGSCGQNDNWAVVMRETTRDGMSNKHTVLHVFPDKEAAQEKRKQLILNAPEQPRRIIVEKRRGNPTEPVRPCYSFNDTATAIQSFSKS